MYCKPLILPMIDPFDPFAHLAAPRSPLEAFARALRSIVIAVEQDRFERRFMLRDWIYFHRGPVRAPTAAIVDPV